MQWCKVRGCRHADTHVTAGHKCGKCGSFGHGARECGRINSLKALESYFDDVLPYAYRCTHQECTTPSLHITAAHICVTCGHLTCRCLPELQCPTCRTWNSVDTSRTVFTNSECVICMERNPCVVFETCRHANVCRNCVTQLSNFDC